VLVNLQKRYVIPSASLTAFARNLKRRLRLGNWEFNICLVDDEAIRGLNLAYLGRDHATDVLSFPWKEAAGPILLEPRPPSRPLQQGGITNFLGDVVISVETARRNAREEGHSALNEIRWLILHGALHLLGYDHERDSGEMIALELALREQLGVAGRLARERQFKIQNSRFKRPKTKFKRQKSKVKAEVV
jgi:probable rRNA maturation factor